MRPSISQETPLMSSRPSKVKRVHFSHSPELGYENGDGSQPQFPVDSTTWWDRVDNNMFRMEASILAENLEFDPILSKCILKAYTCAGKVASSANNEQKLIKKITSMNVDEYLLLWCEGPNNRGLENYFKKTLIRRVGLNKTQRTLESSFCYRMMVIMNQAKMNPEKLRSNCLRLSRQDRVFARMMGDADAMTVRPKSSFCAHVTERTETKSEHSRLTKLLSSANRWSQRQIIPKQA